MNLTSNAIQEMVKKGVRKNNQNKQVYTVMGSKFLKTKGKYSTLYISDGKDQCRAIVETKKSIQIISQFEKQPTFKLIISSFQTFTRNKTTLIQILEFNLVIQTESLKKQPNFLMPEYFPVPTYSLKFQELTQAKNEKMNIQVEEAIKKFDRNSSKLRFIEQDTQSTKPQDNQEIDIRSFQKIDDLYQGMHAWELLVRVIDKSYKQFTSKRGKEIRLLTIQFIDRLGVIIEGTCFGDQALHYQQTIQKSKCYRVARGRIVEQAYKKRASSKHSKYIIKLFSDSSIVQMKDFPEIPYFSKNWLRLSQIQNQSEEQQNFVAIILKIEEQRQFLKGQKTIVMRNLKIGDPITKTLFDVIIWDRQITVDASLLNKSVLLKHFKCSIYKQNLNLYSTFRSQIFVHNFFEDYEEFWKPDLQVKKENCEIKFIKNLSQQLETMQNSTITSHINVWVNSICLGMKWFYDSCPNQSCKKGAVAHSTCSFCSYQIQQCTKRFMLTVQLSDFTGSLFVTAFEEIASLFLKNLTIDELLDLEDNERKMIGDKLTFQNYRMKITSKKDSSGRIKHNILGKPQLQSVENQTKENLNQIEKITSSEMDILHLFP